MIESFRAIPVLNLTSLTEEKDIQACYHLGVNSYISNSVHLKV